jgi:ATP-dependent RNA helicase DDX60
MLLQPAILFNFDRTECEIIAEQVMESLQSAEEEWRKMSPQWQRILSQFEKWVQQSKAREKQAERAKKWKDNDEPQQTQDHSWEASFNPDDPSPQFSFAGSHNSYSNAEMESDLQDLSRWTSVPGWLLAALRRGIAVHHSGMNKRYRSLVERQVAQSDGQLDPHAYFISACSVKVLCEL